MHHVLLLPTTTDSSQTEERAKYTNPDEQSTQLRLALEAEIRAVASNHPELGVPTRSYSTPATAAEMMFKTLSQTLSDVCWHVQLLIPSIHAECITPSPSPSPSFFPKVLPTTALEEEDPEAAMHSSFAAVRRRLYMAPTPLLDALDQHVSARSGPPLLVVEGHSGSGKSALVANWIARWQAGHPDDSIFFHFIGCDTASARLRNMLGRLLVACATSDEEAQRLDNMELEAMVASVPATIEAAAAAAVKAGPGGRNPPKLIIVLDALNQLENESFGWLPGRTVHKLGWLPQTFPDNVRVIVSTLPGPCQDELRARRVPRLETYPLAPADCKLLIERTMNSSAKTLDTAQLQLIMANPCIGNPLFLKLMLEELIAFGAFEELTAKTRELAQCNSVPELLEKILQRLEQSFRDAPVPQLVAKVLRFIGIGREGIMEVELQTLCNVQRVEAVAEGSTASGPSISPFLWSSLYFAIRHLLVDKSGESGGVGRWGKRMGPLRVCLSHQMCFFPLYPQAATHSCTITFAKRCRSGTSTTTKRK